MKFGNLLKKELGELITKQIIISMFIMMALLILMGQVFGSAMKDATSSSSKFAMCDMDNTDFTADLISTLRADGNEINLVTLQSEDYTSEMKRLDIDGLTIIPAGFTDSVLVSKKQAEIISVTVLKGSGLMNVVDGASSGDSIDTIRESLKNEILTNTYGITAEEIDRIVSPVDISPVTIVNDKSANVDASLLSALSMSQSFIIPIAIFLLVMMASSMIMQAISTEKIDKTLETLLSAPVSRLSVLGAKMLSAVIVALMNAVVYMIGFAFYIGGMTGSMTAEIEGAVNEISANSDGIMSTAQAMSQLGLTMTPLNIVLFGVQIFLTIMIALSVSLMLGAMATDVKSVQSLTLPIMLLLMIPYMITMFVDVNALPIAAKIFLYAIPFTHTYTAVSNMIYGHTAILVFGIVYQAVFFVVCMYLATKLFTSDKLFTLSADSLFKKKAATHAE